jgi:hypothetical protein
MVDAYDYTVPETGEVIKLEHQWDYVPEEGMSNTKVVATSHQEFA